MNQLQLLGGQLVSHGGRVVPGFPDPQLFLHFPGDVLHDTENQLIFPVVGQSPLQIDLPILQVNLIVGTVFVEGNQVDQGIIVHKIGNRRANQLLFMQGIEQIPGSLIHMDNLQPVSYTHLAVTYAAATVCQTVSNGFPWRRF